ncbi:MAG TPA: hypothetical protein V6D05_09110 [Stenomitos sp.]
MSDPSLSLSADGRQALVAHLAAAGLRVEERTDFTGVLATGITARCVEEVGDHLAESLRIDPDGRLFYSAGWFGMLPFEAMPDFVTDRPQVPAAPSALQAEPQSHPEWRVIVASAGDPAGRYSIVNIETVLTDPAQLPELVQAMRALAAQYNPAPSPVPSEAASYYLMEEQVVALFQEVIEDQVVGWGTYEVLAAEHGPAMWRATIEQADSRGDRYRYDVIRTAEGVAAEIHGKKDLVVHDWIWRFPIVDRDWTEEVDDRLVSLQVYHVDGPVDVLAGRFWGCVRLSTMNENGSSVHTYHPTAGLILSEFTDVEGTPGRRELFDLVRRVP